MKLTVHDKCALALLIIGIAAACTRASFGAPKLNGVDCKEECLNAQAYASKNSSTTYQCYRFFDYHCWASIKYCLDGTNCLGAVACVDDPDEAYTLKRYDDNSCSMCEPVAVGTLSTATPGSGNERTVKTGDRHKCNVSS